MCCYCYLVRVMFISFSFEQINKKKTWNKPHSLMPLSHCFLFSIFDLFIYFVEFLFLAMMSHTHTHTGLWFPGKSTIKLWLFFYFTFSFWQGKMLVHCNDFFLVHEMQYLHSSFDLTQAVFVLTDSDNFSLQIIWE